jgi:hypothetical protein
LSASGIPALAQVVLGFYWLFSRLALGVGGSLAWWMMTVAAAVCIGYVELGWLCRLAVAAQILLLFVIVSS